MRILEETKYYIIYYQRDPLYSGDIFRKDTILVIYGVLIDKDTKVEYYHYEKYDDNNINNTVISLGKSLIKKWKNKKRMKLWNHSKKNNLCMNS